MRTVVVLLAIGMILFAAGLGLASGLCAVADKLLVLAQQEFLAGLDPDRRSDYTERIERIDGAPTPGERRRLEIELNEFFATECFFRLDIEEYTRRPPAPILRSTLILRFILSGVIFCAAVAALLRRPASRYFILGAAIGLILASGVEGHALARFLPDFVHDLSGDYIATARDLEDDVDHAEIQSPFDEADVVRLHDIGRYCAVYFLLQTFVPLVLVLVFAHPRTDAAIAPIPRT